MVSVVIKGRVDAITPQQSKDGFIYRRMFVTESGFSFELNKRIGEDQTYDITVSTRRMEMIESVQVGDYIEVRCHLNSTIKTNGQNTWYKLSLNLKKVYSHAGVRNI